MLHNFIENPNRALRVSIVHLMPPVSKSIPPEEVANGIAPRHVCYVRPLQDGTPPSAIRWEASLLESPMRIHLVLFLVARKAAIATEQPSGPHTEHTNA
jgi:hypothetical protein